MATVPDGGAIELLVVLALATAGIDSINKAAAAVAIVLSMG
jgi:hypothetical protein